MASSVLRLRRVVSLSVAVLRPITTPLSTIPYRNPNTTAISQLRNFRSSAPFFYSGRDSFRNSNNYGNLDDEIGPDTILFEGCDYNHWLITMEFPKDPAPTREEMIETYLQTLAKVVGSYEEAKKKMYACSTTTYVGFQCLVSEEESEKFKNLPGVVFVLPDSYIDPVNKEYGGDKYDNGVITPRPPPMQYGRQGGRYGDRNRDFNRNPRQMQNEQGSGGYDNQRPRYEDNRNFNQQQNHSMPNQQGNQGYYNQRPRFGDNRNFGPQPNTQVPNHQPSPSYANQGQNPPVQPNYGPTAGVERRNPLPNNYHQVPNQQPSSGYANQGPTYDVNRQEQHPHMQPNYGSTVGGERTGPLPTNASPWGRDAMPPFQGSSNNYQNQQGFHNPQGERMPEQRGYTGDTRNYASPQGGVAQGHGAEGNYGQTGGGNFGQTQEGSFVKGVNVRDHPPSFNYQNDYTGEDEAKNSKDRQTQERNHVQMGQAGNQGRY